MKKEKLREMVQDGWVPVSRGQGYESYKKNEVAYRHKSKTLYIPEGAQALMGLEPGEDHVKLLKNDEQGLVAIQKDDSGIKFTDSKTISATKVSHLLSDGTIDVKCKIEHNDDYDIWVIKPTDETA
ncbi:MAG: hypothetical protein ACOC80_10535 [Petrotogales bacterium]